MRLARWRPAVSPAPRSTSTRLSSELPGGLRIGLGSSRSVAVNAYRGMDISGDAGPALRRQRGSPCQPAAMTTATAREESVRFDVPLYSVSEAARHIDVPRSTFDTWVRGYARRPKGRSPVVGAPVVTLIPSDGGPSVPFVG